MPGIAAGVVTGWGVQLLDSDPQAEARKLKGALVSLDEQSEAVCRCAVNF